MTGAQGHRLRGPLDGRLEAGTGPELRDEKRHPAALSRCAQKDIIRHLQDLTFLVLVTC